MKVIHFVVEKLTTRNCNLLVLEQAQHGNPRIAFVLISLVLMKRRPPCTHLAVHLRLRLGREVYSFHLHSETKRAVVFFILQQ